MSTQTSTRVIRVLTADAQPLYGDALARAVRQRPHLLLVGEAVDGRAALAAIRTLQPDVAVLASALPGLDGRRVVNAVVRDRIPTRVLLLAGERSSPNGAYDAIATGAAGFLSKRATSEQLDEAIRRIAAGDVVIAPEAQAAVAAEIRLRARDDRPLFSAREREIVALLARGLTTPEIGRRLCLGTATVKTHMQRLYEKLGVSERAAAVAEAMRRGLLE